MLLCKEILLLKILLQFFVAVRTTNKYPFIGMYPVVELQSEWDHDG